MIRKSATGQYPTNGQAARGRVPLAMLAIVALAAAIGFDHTAAQSPPKVSIQLQHPTVAAGETFEAYVWVEDAVDLVGFDTVVTYDESYLSLREAEVAEAFLGSGGRDVLPLGPEITPGRVVLGAATVPGSGQAGADGAGDLAVLVFRGLAAGQAVVGLGEVRLVDGDGNRWTVQGEGATVPITVGGTTTQTPAASTATPDATPLFTRHLFLPWLARRD